MIPDRTRVRWPPRRIAAGLYVAFLAAVLARYLQSYPIPGFLDKLAALATVALFCAAATVLGRDIKAWLAVDDASPVYSVLFAFGGGLGALGGIVLILGWPLPGSLNAKLSGLWIALGVYLLCRLRSFRGLFSRSAIGARFSPIEVLSLALAGFGITAMLLASFAPITYYDSLVYHLALPKIYLQQDRIASVPFNLYSHFPAGVEMLFLFFLRHAPSPDACINLLGWTISLALSAGVAQWCRDLSQREAAPAALALWWTAPVALFLSIGAYVDIPLAFFTVLSLRAFFNAGEKLDIRWIFLAGLFGGFAAATKYTGAITPLILGILVLFTRQASIGDRLRKFVVLGASALAPLAPWLVKNAVEISNPVFPFLYRVFGGAAGWTGETAAGYFALLTEYDHQSAVFLDLLAAPWRLLSSATRFGGGFDVLGDFGWIPFLFLAPLAFLHFRENRAIRMLCAYAVLHGLVWYVGKPVLRFLVPLLPVLVILTVVAVSRIGGPKSKTRRAAGALFIGPLLVSNVFLFFFVNQDLQLFSVPFGFESRDQYLERRLEYYPVFRHLNGLEDPEVKVMVIGEPRTYHLDHDVVAANLFGASPAAAWANAAESGESFRSALVRAGITHVVLNRGEIERLGGFEAFSYSPKGEANLRSFVQSGLPRGGRHGDVFLIPLSSG